MTTPRAEAIDALTPPIDRVQEHISPEIDREVGTPSVGV
jgi:hypothetical protein